MLTCPTCNGSDLSPTEDVVDIRGEGPSATVWAEHHTCLACSSDVYHVFDQDAGDDWVEATLGGVSRGPA